MSEKGKEYCEKQIEEANKLNEDMPGELFKKLGMYGEVKEIYGDLEARYIRNWKLSKAKRKEVEDMVKVYGAELKEERMLTNDEERKDEMPMVKPKTATTDKMREAIAGVMAKPYQDEEDHYEAVAKHWGNKYQSISEQINIMKKRYDHLVNVARGGV